MSRSWRSLVALGTLLLGTGGCVLFEDYLSKFEPCPDTSSPPTCGSDGMEHHPVGVTIEDSIVRFSWDGAGADSVVLYRGATVIWAIRRVAGSAALTSPLVYGSHPDNSTSYVDSVPWMTTAPNYTVFVRRGGLPQASTAFGYTAP